MTDIQSYRKSLCMNELRADRCRFSVSHRFDSRAGSAQSSFCYIKRGSVRIYSPGLEVSVPEGGVFYLPEGARYRAVWSGSPEIEYYALHVITETKKPRATDMSYPIQHLAEASSTEFGARFAEILSLMATGERIPRIRAIGIYYALYAELLPMMEAKPPVKHHDSLISALDFIEKHYTESFSVGELAAAACISEPRLYHLFRRELGTTPLAYRTELRISRAAEELRGTSRPIEEIAALCGFHSAAYLREVFRAAIGISPRDFRRAHSDK